MTYAINRNHEETLRLMQNIASRAVGSINLTFASQYCRVSLDDLETTAADMGLVIKTVRGRQFAEAA